MATIVIARTDVASHNVVPKTVIETSPYSPPSQADCSSAILTNPVNVVCVGGAGVGGAGVGGAGVGGAGVGGAGVGAA